MVAGAVRNDMDRLTETVAALRRYLRAHPQACDTVEGIAIWWLGRQQPRATLEAVAQAVAQLVEGGEMEFWSGPDGQTVYRAARPLVGS